MADTKMDYSSVPQDESTRGGRQAARDEVNLRSRYGDAKVMKHSPYHNKAKATGYMDVTTHGGRSASQKKVAPGNAVTNPDRINKMLDKIWENLG